jgi:hypothetical protein
MSNKEQPYIVLGVVLRARLWYARALGPGAISHGRGEEKPKGTEQLETLEGDRVAGAATRSDRGDLALRCSARAAAMSR